LSFADLRICDLRNLIADCLLLVFCLIKIGVVLLKFLRNECRPVSFSSSLKAGTPASQLDKAGGGRGPREESMKQISEVEKNRRL
jgi:hypothetical protein